MKRYGLYLLVIIAVSTQYSCTDKYKDINTNPYGLTNEQLQANFANVSAYFGTAQSNLIENGPWLNQLDNFYGDNFCGYLYPPSAFRDNKFPCTFFNQDGWQDGLWGNAYSSVMRQTEQIINNAKATTPATPNSQSQLAIALVMRVAGMHLVSDGWGPIIYSHYKTANADGSYTYDTQQEAYNAFFADLDTAVTTLSSVVDGGTTTAISNLDIVYQGDLVKWIKAANSMRFRLALRLTRIDAATAKAQAQKAMSEPHGLITTNSDLMHVYFNSTLGSGLAQVSRDWTDIRLGADFESILKGYNDPRLAVFFSPATDAAVSGQYKGIRAGADVPNNDKSFYVGYSAVNNTTFGANPASSIADLNVISAPEVNFMLAEAALRGWLTGAYAGVTAKTYYEAGIKAHFDMYNLTSAQYQAYVTGTSLPAAYVDPKRSIHDNAAVNNVPVAYNEAGSNEYQLQQIITQKWIALFPNGKEAWSELRRTGYPKVFKNYLNYSGGTISTDEGAKRIFKFAVSEYQNNAAGVVDATSKLGGPDVGGTRLWWDPASNTSNF